ncbi:MAG: phenylalanine--tRNA ligase subunit beta [Verrucomicrobia bacterium]|nr:phenylalanine--tRNA ligase subunit beta [Verrucomicrobiota bacterium]
MKVPISSLKKYLDLEITPEALANVLTLGGIEVEGIETTPLKFSGVVVGEVLHAEQHPSADRLKVATVSDGTEKFQVVCAAPNCRAGIRVAFAKIGATLEDETGKPFKIKKSKLRDVESYGMLCAADELGLGPREEGIMELSTSYTLGTDLASYHADTILDVSLTPNLGHCMSLYGLARDLSALLGIPLKKPTYTVKEEGAPIDFRVHLIDGAQAPVYTCRLVRDVVIGPSPDWLRATVEACGIRSINNVVDIGNFVMLELGQPLHMFDADKISGKELFITSQTPYVGLETLDEIERPIPSEVLLICDKEKPLAFAGVMGGRSSAITEATRSVAIESAYFTPQAVRKTGRLTHLKTDSSQRFEKGVDPLGVHSALDYAAELLRTVASGQVATGFVEHKTHAFHPKKIACRAERVNTLLGTNLSVGEISSLLTRLGMSVTEEGAKTLLVSVPSYRSDIEIEVDLIEEVGRVYGYNNIPKKSPAHISSTLSHAPAYLLEKEVRRRLISEGLQELMTCDLISPEQAKLNFSHETPLTVLHSKSSDFSVLRSSLLPGLLQVVKHNLAHGNLSIAGFEVGRVHFKQGDEYIEPTAAAIVLCGKKAPYHWDPKPEPFDFYDLKGIVENLLDGLGIENALFEFSHMHHFHPGRQAKILHKDATIGTLGELHPTVLDECGIKERVYFAEVNLHEVIPFVKAHQKVEALPAYPGSERDWTVTLDAEMPIDKLMNATLAVPSRLLENVILLDLYKSDQIGKDRKNATLRFFYRDREKTIAFETVEREHERITAAVADKIQIRG